MPEGAYKKKLIEVALPLDVINREAAREKSIRHGHPATLHMWWARRPLAACRAVLFAQMVDDPSAHPEAFPTERAQEEERKRLFAILENLVKLENTGNEDVLEAARAEIRRSCDGELPPIVDPFAGGGSIPLEAQRLGLKTLASDLNPVPVLINKALIEIPTRWPNREPVHPDDGVKLGTATWTGVEGLAEDVRHYALWMRDEAERRIGQLYPTATLSDGSEAKVISWIWARTVTCPNPACGAQMPLISSFWLSKKKGNETWAQPIIEKEGVRFEIGRGSQGPPDSPKTGRGAKFKCLVCDGPAPDTHIKSEGMQGRMGTQLMAIAAQGNRRREYLAPTDEHIQAANLPRPVDVPTTELVDDPRAIWCRAYGLLEHADLFTNRQLAALCTLSDLVEEAQAKVVADATSAGLDANEALQYGADLATYLAFIISKLADLANSLCRWEPNAECPRQLFARQAIPMVWDFAEGNPFSSSSGSFEILVENLMRTMKNPLFDFDRAHPGRVRQADATKLEQSGSVIFCTDPPYYDNIGYADLADFFYVWLRRSLRKIYPELLQTMLTPKAEELVATPYRFGGSKDDAREFFEEGFIETFDHVRQHQSADYPTAIFYAFKQSEDTADGHASTGWETMLEGLRHAGLMVTGTWPMRTEMGSRMVGQGTNALASSIVLACRSRAQNAGVTDRAGFISSLREELPGELKLLQQAAIAPVDLAQASIGPGMAVFSRYAKVIEPSGDSMRVRTALGLINQVLAEVLEAGEEAIDPPTRWALKWFEQRGFDEGPFGEAEVLATATGVAVDGLVREGIVRSVAGKVRLLEREELPDDWDPATDDRLSVWEATQHLVKALEEGGETAAAVLLDRLGGMGDSAQALSYRLYSLCERKGWAKEAGPYNALAAVWGALRTLKFESPISEEVTQESLL